MTPVTNASPEIGNREHFCCSAASNKSNFPETPKAKRKFNLVREVYFLRTNYLRLLQIFKSATVVYPDKTKNSILKNLVSLFPAPEFDKLPCRFLYEVDSDTSLISDLNRLMRTLGSSLFLQSS